MMLISIGQLARRTGATLATLRFYERKGLIVAPQRSKSGYRQYPPEVVKRVRFIQRAKKVGFSLNEIEELLAMRQKPDTPCADIKLHTTRKVQKVDQKLKDLKRIRGALERMIMKCTGRGDLPRNDGGAPMHRPQVKSSAAHRFILCDLFLVWCFQTRRQRLHRVANR